MASVVGKSLYVDLCTKQMKMISFARVCVEISATQPRCNSVDIDLDGKSCSVEIEYKWRPIACLSYGAFGQKCAQPLVPLGPEGEAQQDSIVELFTLAIQPLAPVSEAVATSAGPGLEWNRVGGRRKKHSLTPKEGLSSFPDAPFEMDQPLNLKGVFSGSRKPSTFVRRNQRHLKEQTQVCAPLETPVITPKDKPATATNSIASSSFDDELDGPASQVSSSDDDDLLDPPSPRVTSTCKVLDRR